MSRQIEEPFTLTRDPRTQKLWILIEYGFFELTECEIDALLYFLEERSTMPYCFEVNTQAGVFPWPRMSKAISASPIEDESREARQTTATPPESEQDSEDIY